MIIYYTDGFSGGHAASRSLLERAITEYTGDAGQASKLVSAVKTGEMGKPYIDGFSHFSVSHTGNFWAVLLADAECGLDIQLPKKCDAAAIARRIFAPEDADLVASLEGEAALEVFFRMWTRREALVKAFGGSVYETDLPSVQPSCVIINGSEYNLADTALPGLPYMRASVCVKGGPFGAPDIQRL